MIYDLVIVGGSAAATSAGIYAARRGLKFKIISKDFGGEVATSGEIGNWPGINQTDGITLAGQFKEHLKFYKVDMEEGVEVEKIMRNEDGTFCITTKKGEPPAMASSKAGVEPPHSNMSVGASCDYEAKTVIVTTGVHPRELNVPGEKEFRNKGVSYCTVCDGPLFGGKVVAVIGGGNSALEASLMMSDVASKTYVINKNPAFKGDQVLIDNLKTKQNVGVIYNANTTEIVGDQFVNGLKYSRTTPTPEEVGTLTPEGTSEELQVQGIFIHIGNIPNSGIVPPEVEKNQFGEIKVDTNCKTNILGLYAAGDVTDVPFKQIVIAAGQGCCAVLSAVNYLNKMK